MARSNKYTSLNFNDIFDKQLSNTTTTTTTSSSSSSTTTNKLSSSYLSASRLTHGGMLVLSRPSPKPQPQPQQPPPPVKPSISDSISLRPKGKTGVNLSSCSSPSPSQAMTNSANTTMSPPKCDKFVPPHLRAGFVPKDVVTPPPAVKPAGFRPGFQYHFHGSPHNHRPGSSHGYHNQFHGSPDNHMTGSGHGSYDNHRPVSGHGYQNQYHGSPNNKYMENGRVQPGGGYRYNNHGSLSDNFRPRSAHGSVQENGNGYFSGVGGSYLGYTNRPRSGGNRPNSSGW